MTRFFLTELKVEGFRGINNEGDPLVLRFKPDAVNSVFAANGLGKSSVFEALSFAITGKIPKLERLQSHERAEEYVRNRFHSKNIAIIEMEFQPDDNNTPTVRIRIDVDSSGKRAVSSPSAYPDPELFLHGLNEDFMLLDHQTFDGFIDSTPLQRGRSFSALLGLSSYSSLRQTLQTASDTRVLNSDLNIPTLRAEVLAGSRRLSDLMDRMSKAHDGIVGDDSHSESSISEKGEVVLDALRRIDLLRDSLSEDDLAGVDFDSLRRKIREAEGGEKRGKLTQVIGKIIEASAIAEAGKTAPKEELGPAVGSSDQEAEPRAALLDLLEERDELLLATRGPLFQRLYQATNAILLAGAWAHADKCPLCESDLAKPIMTIVQEYLSAYAQVAEKVEGIKTATVDEPWVARLRTLENAAILAIPEEEKLAGTVVRGARDGSLATQDARRARDRVPALEESLKEALEDLKARRTALERELPESLVNLTEQVELASQFASAFSQFQDESPLVLTKAKQSNVRKRWQGFISNAATTFSEAEAEMARDRISEIDADYQAMFATIVGTEDVVPELARSEKKEDLEVNLSSFYGDAGVSARALLPESQRNALAISVFLSAALKKGGPPRFLVLDDVTSSFNAGHQWQLMEHLRGSLRYPANPDGLQFIVLSHDGLLEKYFEKLNQTAGWNHLRLEGSPPKGAVIAQQQNANPLRDSILQFLKTGRVKQAEPLLRQYLESKLIEIISRVGIPVPLDFAMKDQKRMVSNSLAAIGGAVELHRKAGTLVLSEQQESDLEKVLLPQLVGNWVNHYETGVASSLAPLVLERIVKTIDGLAECFCYDDSSQGAVQRRWYKSLSRKA